MSLKALHIVFITASTLLAFVFSVWGLRRYLTGGGDGWDLVIGIGSLAAGIGLIWYGRYVLRKLKHISYL